MKTDLLKKENIQILSGRYNWQEAIHRSTAPLIHSGCVQKRYAEEIIKNTEEFGPYYILAPGVAMPHARPEQGVNETQLAVALFREPVAFPGRERDTQLFVVLAAADKEKHLEAMAEIAETLDRDGMIEKMCSARNPETLYQLFAEEAVQPADE